MAQAIGKAGMQVQMGEQAGGQAQASGGGRRQRRPARWRQGLTPLLHIGLRLSHGPAAQGGAPALPLRRPAAQRQAPARIGAGGGEGLGPGAP